MSRRWALSGVAGAVAIGAGSRLWPIGVGVWDKSVGDVAYAVMIAFVVLFVWPRAKPIAIGGIAIGICFAIEVFQLTGLPRRAPRLLRIALGDTFAWHDMACYVVGGLVAGAIVLVLSRRAASGDSPST